MTTTDLFLIFYVCMYSIVLTFGCVLCKSRKKSILARRRSFTFFVDFPSKCNDTHARTAHIFVNTQTAYPRSMFISKKNKLWHCVCTNKLSVLSSVRERNRFTERCAMPFASSSVNAFCVIIAVVVVAATFRCASFIVFPILFSTSCVEPLK